MYKGIVMAKKGKPLQKLQALYQLKLPLLTNLTTSKKQLTTKLLQEINFAILVPDTPGKVELNHNRRPTEIST